MIMLRRLTYPNRWCDLQSIFGRSQSELCLIFKNVSLGSYHYLVGGGGRATPFSSKFGDGQAFLNWT
jgi:hypothetical protein